MNESTTKIKNIIKLNDYINNLKNYKHLFEVQLPPDDIKIWKPRFNYELGTLLVGDLLLDLEEENMLEIHPFPEWVVQLQSLGKINSKPYLVVPNFSNSFVKKLSRKSIDERVNIIQEKVENLAIDDLIAFEYEIGINILVPAFIPHFFISSKINKEAGELPPYLQVFEPNFEKIIKVLKIKATYFFKLPFTVII